VAKYVALTVRKLKPGTYDDWRKAWEGDRSDWPDGVHAYVARNPGDPDEIVAFGLVERDDLSDLRSDEMAQEQQARTDAMAPYIDSVGVDGIYEVIDEVST
jgi:hypothetical protein